MRKQITTVFKKGIKIQAVRIPKEFQLQSKEVWIEKIGSSLIHPQTQFMGRFFRLKTESISIIKRIYKQ